MTFVSLDDLHFLVRGNFLLYSEQKFDLVGVKNCSQEMTHIEPQKFRNKITSLMVQ